MEIITIIMLVILLAFDGFILYDRFKQEKPKEIKPKLTREEKEKQKRMKESFDNLMKYDEQTARKRK